MPMPYCLPGIPEKREVAMRILDSHVHLKHGDAAATEYTPAEIVRVMDAVGIEKSVVFAMSTTTRRSIELGEAAATAFPERLIPYVYALPSYERPALPEMEEAITQRGFRGIKLHAWECRLIASLPTGLARNNWRSAGSMRQASLRRSSSCWIPAIHATDPRISWTASR